MRNLITKLSVTAIALVAVVGASVVPVAASAAAPDLSALRAAMSRPAPQPRTKTVCHIVPTPETGKLLSFKRVCEEVRVQTCRIVPTPETGRPLSYVRICE